MERENQRLALVTGAGNGIGAAIARKLAQDNMLVLVSDVDISAAERTTREIAEQGLSAEAIQLNLADPASVAAAFAKIEAKFGRCDVLVNNAGVATTCAFLDFPLEKWQLTMDVNVTGALLCSQYAARLMVKRQWGRIVNISSISGLRAGTGRTAYGTSKAALIGLTRQIAIELAEHGITANSIAPGPVDTTMTRALHSDLARESYNRAVPMRRYGTTDEIAAAVSFLTSADASYITGHVMPVDGGFMAAGMLEA
jgi:3-oxoacyl-[acyl-carrier protein] reductase